MLLIGSGKVYNYFRLPQVLKEKIPNEKRVSFPPSNPIFTHVPLEASRGVAISRFIKLNYVTFEKVMSLRIQQQPSAVYFLKFNSGFTKIQKGFI